MVSEIDRAWVAGMIDADGCVTLTPSGRRYRNPTVVVDSTDIEILEELARLYGGGKLVTKGRKQAHHRQGWSWRLYGADQIIAALTEILPYMRCPSKRERARMIIEEYKTVTPRNGRYTIEMRDAKEAWEDRFMATGAGRGSQCKIGE